MNLRFAGRLFFGLAAIAFLSFGFHQYINSAMGVSTSLFDSAWQLLALALGFSLVGGFAYPYVRGVRRGDLLIAELARTRSFGGQVLAYVESVPVTAVSDGREGQTIRVQLGNGKSAEGVVAGYAGTFTPALVKITETEV